MFPKQKTVGFVFKKQDIGEADRIYSLYTRDFGRIEVLGKGIRKISAKLRGALELFSFSEIEFVKGKIFKRLTDANLIEQFERLRKDLRRLKIAFKISKVLDELIKGEEKDERILDLILETFNRLNDYFLSPSLQKTLFWYFFWNILNLLGYVPQIDSCIFCQRKLKKPPFYFSFKEKGFLCFKCFKKKKEGERAKIETMKLIKLFLKRDLNTLEKLRLKKEILEDLEKFSKKYFNLIEK